MLSLAPTFDGRRTIPSPECRKLILDILQLGPQDKVLEIGTGSGTQTNDFAATGAEVHSIELEPWVDTTQILGDCVYLHTGDGAKGLPAYAPYTAIVVTAGAEQVVQAWRDQLLEGGRLVLPIGDSASQKLTLFRKVNGELIPVQVSAYTRFQMMREKPAPKPPKYYPHECHVS